MFKNIKYNRSVQKFILFLDSLELLTFDNGNEYVFEKWTTILLTNTATNTIVIYYYDIEQLERTYSLTDDEIAYIIHKKYNKHNYEIVINYGMGYDFKNITKVFEYDKEN